MPFQSEKQRRYLHANHPEIAKRWEKEYAHGGILDINESQEIISDDGNDIELTAYNAAFDDPKDLSTGVKTLFQAKNGGSYAMQGGVKNYLGDQEMVNAPKHWKSAPDHPDTELTYITKPEKDLLVKADLHGSLHGSVNKGPSDIISLNGWGDAGDFDGPSSSTGGGAPPGEKGGAGYIAPVRSRIQDERQEEFRKKEMAKTIARGPGSDWEKYDTDLVDMEGEPVMTPEENYLARRNMIKSKYTGKSIQRKDALTNNYNTERARLEKAVNKKILKIFGGFVFLGKPPTLSSLVDFDPFAEKKLTGIIPEAYALDQLKKQHISDLTDIKESLLADVDINNPNEMKNLDDTAFSEVMKELGELNKTKEKDDDTGGDGPTLPQVLPIGEEIEEYEDTYAMSPWDRIKANQAKRALLVEKGIIQENPIVDESVTDITMQANRGGLANLFRVKNQ